MKKELISVIVPVYKVEEYLEECLLSIINQTYKELEIILIDDGSPDRCGEICDNYAKKDNRIKVIHKNNGGLSSARNAGLDIAKGEYIIFVDSDDYLFENAIEFLYSQAIENQADLSIGGVLDSKVIIETPCTKTVVDRKEGLRLFFVEKYFQCTVWAKLYKKDLIGKERFDENKKLIEDFDFSYRIMKRVNRTAINNSEKIYFYRIREGSLMRQKYNKDFEKEIDFSEEALNDLIKEYPDLKDYAIRRYQRVIISCIDKYFKEKLETKGVRYLMDRYKKYPNKVEMFLKIKLFMLLHCPKITKKIYIRLGKI